VTEGCAVPFCSLFAAGRALQQLQRSGRQQQLQQQTRTCVPLRALQTTTAAAGDKRTKKGYCAPVAHACLSGSPASRHFTSTPANTSTVLSVFFYLFFLHCQLDSATSSQHEQHFTTVCSSSWKWLVFNRASDAGA
jgi:hypothetical protein